jgi:hypothetical protein
MDSFCVLGNCTRPIYESKVQGSLQRTRLFPNPLSPQLNANCLSVREAALTIAFFVNAAILVLAATVFR